MICREMAASVYLVVFIVGLAIANAEVLNNDTITNSTNHINCDDGLVIPCWRPLDNVPTSLIVLRGIIYFASLLYLFIGVSIISDRFMAAIEVITSQEKEVKVAKGSDRQIVVVRVWNETIANLTLMALGSSAPEILLSIIEIWAKNFQAGELGPGTIVGSAAYNLFVIMSLCVSVIPNGQVRKIKHLRVFFVTATWSVFAYVWLYLILAVISPGVVEIWEGLVTFLFFPATVLTAYAAEQRMLPKYLRKGYRMNVRGVIVQSEGADGTDNVLQDDSKEDAKHEYINTLRELRKQHPSADLDSLERMAHELLINRGPKSRAFYRIQATRKLMGSGDILRKISERAQSDLSEVKAEIRRESTATFNPVIASRVFFEPNHYTVLESCGRFEVRVVRTGDLDEPCVINYCTEDGSATAGSDYIAQKGQLRFAPGENEKFITLEVIDDDVFEQDEHFFIRLSGSSIHAARTLVSPAPATVVILDDDHSGVFRFPAQNYELVESVGTFELKVERCSGARGKVIVPYTTEDGTAKAGKEYEENVGELVFDNNESEQSIPLYINEEDSYEKDVLFYVQLGEPRIADEDALQVIQKAEKKPPNMRTEQEKIALMGRPRLGDVIRAQIRIKESKEFKNTVDKLVQRANASLLIGTSSWKEQFVDAITVNPDADEDEEKSISCLDYLMHFLTVFWKVLGALIPPTDIAKGYLCFVVSILCIGIVTAVIGDVASHFGATMGIKDSVTAIVFVALGTSIPDTFASKVAAIQDKYADASVGNVTGSNAVNVFLGIGIAWSIAAIYHGVRGQPFLVNPGSLAFSVTIFCSGAVLTIIVMLIRRAPVVGGELGGPVCIKYCTSVFLFSLWLTYLVLSSLEVYGVIPGF